MATRFPPDREAELVTFTQNFSEKILSSPQNYSLTSEQAAAYAILSSAFVDAYGVANAGETRSPVNITLKDEAKAAMIANLRMLAKVVQNSPKTTNAIRDELNLPRRGGTPTSVPAPGKPFKFSVLLDSTGALTLKWKCDNPAGSQGTMYQVWRRIGSGKLTYLGGVGKKQFTDDTLPAGTSEVTYSVQAVRSTVAGERANYNVNIGVESVIEIPQMKQITAVAA